MNWWSGRLPLGVLTQPLLHAGGQTVEQVTRVDQTVTSAGHRIRLVGAYADGLQTTVYLQVDGQPMAAPVSPGGKVMGDHYLASVELTDDSGRHYTPRGGSGTSVLDFEPLSGTAAGTGVRLTLHVSQLHDLTYHSAIGGKHDVPPHVDGSWTFHFTLKQRPAHELPLPAPLQVGDTTYTFTSIRSADTLAVKIKVGGGAVRRWNQMKPGETGLPPGVADAYRVHLYDAAGRPQRKGYGSLGGDRIDLSWVIDGPGRYRLHMGGAQSGADLWFDVPRD